MVTIQLVNRICYTICVGCIVLGAVLLFVLIWVPTQSETVQKGFLSILVLFLASLLTMGVTRFFLKDREAAKSEAPPAEKSGGA